MVFAEHGMGWPNVILVSIEITAIMYLVIDFTRQLGNGTYIRGRRKFSV